MKRVERIDPGALNLAAGMMGSHLLRWEVHR